MKSMSYSFSPVDSSCRWRGLLSSLLWLWIIGGGMLLPFAEGWRGDTKHKKWWSLAHTELVQVDSIPKDTLKSYFTSSQLRQFLGFRHGGARHRSYLSPVLVQATVIGLHRAVTECTFQFQKHRWNCSVFGQDELSTNSVPVLGNIMTKAVPETGFFHALLSATITQTVAEACVLNVENCPCNNRGRDSIPNNGTWMWRGCDHNVHFGKTMARRFLDAGEIGWHVNPLINRHNNKVGRKFVLNNMRYYCQCHGVSGSCSSRTCLRKTPYLRTIGDFLKERYHDAVKVIRDNSIPQPWKYSRSGEQNRNVASRNSNANRKKNRRKKRRSGLLKASEARKGELVRPSADELVYFDEPTPGSFCESDPVLGVRGTHGRQCNSTIEGPDNCQELCCGRGFVRSSYYTYADCRCRFKYCCEVICDRCTVYKTVETCK